MENVSVSRLMEIRSFLKELREEIDAIDSLAQQAVQRASGQKSFAVLCDEIEQYARHHETFTIQDLRAQIGVIEGSTLNSAVFKLKKKQRLQLEGRGRYRSLVWQNEWNTAMQKN